MPPTLTYPGVYIEEVPSGVRTLTGVATSITAFVGRALRGPVNRPVTVNSYGDYERIFGGLWLESAMSFVVRDFFLNGGSQAVIVRLARNATRSFDPTPSVDARNTGSRYPRGARKKPANAPMSPSTSGR